MAKKFFDYSFQIHRTRKTGIIFVVFIILVVGGAFLFYKSKTELLNVKKLNYKLELGMEEFEDTSCDKAYRVGYKKNTCGTICLKVLKKNSKYLENTKDQMIKNGFIIDNINKSKINSKNWRYFTTKNDGPIITYYSSDFDNNTYVLEFISQANYLTKTNKKECNSIINKFTNSVKLK